jgi:hypothetical protein
MTSSARAGVITVDVLPKKLALVTEVRPKAACIRVMAAPKLATASTARRSPSGSSGARPGSDLRARGRTTKAAIAARRPDAAIGPMCPRMVCWAKLQPPHNTAAARSRILACRRVMTAFPIDLQPKG